MGRTVFSFLRRDDGVVAVIFAVMAIPFIAMAGWAVDYLRIQHVKEYLQIQVDAAALNATMLEDPEAVDWNAEQEARWEVVHAATVAEIGRTYQGSWANNVELVHNWPSREVDVRVTARAEVPLAFIKILPGVDETQLVEVSAVARVNEVVWQYDIELADLDYEAGDYNRVWAYCFWPNRWEHSELPRRTQMVPIADNGGPANKRNIYTKDDGAPQVDGADSIRDPELRSMYEDAVDDSILGLDGREEGVYRIVDGAGTGSREYAYIAPLCQGDSYLSFRLENVRFARAQHNYWDKSDPYGHTGPDQSGADHSGRYDYYTDTYPDETTGSLEFSGLTHPRSGSEADVLETVLCETPDECRPDTSGGIIPTGTNRSEGALSPRERASGDCPPGKYMYLGWEDRPPEMPYGEGSWLDEGWSDADYDDIRVILQCPELKPYGDRNARLIG